MTTRITQALDTVKTLVKESRFLLHSDRAIIVTHDGKEWLMEYTHNYDGLTIPHYGLSCSTKAVAFETLAELKGWLRCYRSLTHNI